MVGMESLGDMLKELRRWRHLPNSTVFTENGCRGDSIRYRICNMQPCKDRSDFRAMQCKAYDNRPYRGRLYDWKPFHDPEDPCSLTCQAKSFLFVAKLAHKAQDGTRCRKGSLDMCVEGVCMSVGCDLQLGSAKKIDECGICGGNGTSCKYPTYEWSETDLSPCSVTCGGGYQMSRPICSDTETRKEFPERFCDFATRPRPQIRLCNTQVCPAIWITEDWGPCSVPCGGGFQTRNVKCVPDSYNRTNVQVNTRFCFPPKPVDRQPCNTRICPRWFEGPWSECSVTCGQGYQQRSVVCRNSDGHLSPECKLNTRPVLSRTCVSRVPCAVTKDTETEDLRHSQTGVSLTTQTNESSRPKTQTKFKVGEWEPCSATCGEGTKRRSVECIMYLEFAKTASTLPDNECPGPRPPGKDICFIQPCDNHRKSPEGGTSVNHLEEWIQQKADGARGRLGDKSKHVIKYFWKRVGMSPCSASCLGGTQELMVECVRDYDTLVVAPYLCDIDKKPNIVTQTCNNFPCPSRWNLTEFSSCSKSCGGGIQNRKIQCIQELERKERSVLVLRNNMCPQPPPRSQQYCNVIDCPARWQVGEWSKCSHLCGGGVRTRKIKCVKVVPFDHKINQPQSSCQGDKPAMQEICGMKPCQEKNKSNIERPPSIKISKQDYIQQEPIRNVKLDIGGRAVLLERTTVRIRCPVQRFNRSHIRWQKEHKDLAASRKYRFSNRGTLKIKNISLMDAGQYTCRAGSAKADITLIVRPLPFKHLKEGIAVEGSNLLGDKKDPHIKLTQQSYTQSYPKERVNLKIGGMATLYSGSDAKIRCPVSGYDRSLVQWFKGNMKLSHNNKYEISPTGAMTIKSLRLQDSGKYTCVAGSSRAHMIIDVKPVYSKFSHDVDRTVERPEVPSEYSHEDSGHGITSSAVDDTKSHFDFRPRTTNPEARPLARFFSDDESYEKSFYEILRPERLTGSSRFPLSSTSSHDASKPTYVTEFDSWELHHSGRPDFHLGRKDIHQIVTPRDSEQYINGSSRQTDHHSFPRLQSLLKNMSKAWGNSKDSLNRYLFIKDQKENPNFNRTANKGVKHLFEREWTETLKFEWFITPWSTCSGTCGEKAFQTRSSQCLLKIDDKQANHSRVVDHKLCVNAGLKPPLYIRHCGISECPRWKIAEWAECLDISCTSLYTGKQNRRVSCSFSNGTEVSDSNCARNEKPIVSRECFNPQCFGVWKVEPWSECNANCGEVGFKNRIVKCVWPLTDEPAGNSCKPEARPSVMEHCTGPPCLSGDSCQDNSKYCGLSKRLNICKLAQYRIQCCRSCTQR
ncbi:protein madd-4-like isoform X2 [Tachypleus tridentatus]|uniref:protein madd-4-like isoform X2 n=1 Tax=Tachypleus tridentatus TaxID=6853 RepID=UPI003FD69D05